MLKGADAAMLAVSRTFKLKTQTRPVYYNRDTEDSGDYVRRTRDPVALFNIKPTSKNHHSTDQVEWVGDEFRVTKEDSQLGDEEEELPMRLEGEDWVKPYAGIHWLNHAQHIEPNRAYVTVPCLEILFNV